MAHRMRAQTVVVGAGVVGIATARALAKSGREVLILESESLIGSGSSSRNSEVVHAGIYYSKGSLKAKACVEGRRLLYAYCDTHGVAYKRCGKLLVATDSSELPALKSISDKAAANGLTGPDELLRVMSPTEVADIEPHVTCVGALHSPSTGIVDSHAFMLALLGDAQRDGATLALGTSVVDGCVLPSGRLLLRTAFSSQADRGSDQPSSSPSSYSEGESESQDEGGFESLELECDEVVNTAGHAAIPLARRIVGMPQDLVPPQYWAKGSYFGLAGMPSPFRGLVYPLPSQAGLGVHATVDLGGRCRFGPDVQWTDRHDDLDVDVSRAESFYDAVRLYWPALPDGALVADYAGVRPKIAGPGEAAADFVLLGPREHGVRGLLHHFGIESPGLTSSLALARASVEMLSADR